MHCLKKYFKHYIKICYIIYDMIGDHDRKIIIQDFNISLFKHYIYSNNSFNSLHLICLMKTHK